MQHIINISLLRVKKGLLTGLALVSIVVMHDPLALGPKKKKKVSTGVLLGLRNLLLPAIGLHHMKGRFLHLLTLLRIKFPLDHHWDHQKDHHQNRRTLQLSLGPELKKINLDPSLCLLLTQQPSLGGHSFPEENGERYRANKVTRTVVEIIEKEKGHRIVNINYIIDIGNRKVAELISYNQLVEHLETAQDKLTEVRHTSTLLEVSW